jgi:hypothetical protein
MEASQEGDLEALQRALPEGCDASSINRKDEDGRTALVSQFLLCLFMVAQNLTDDVLSSALGGSNQVSRKAATFRVCCISHISRSKSSDNRIEIANVSISFFHH